MTIHTKGIGKTASSQAANRAATHVSRSFVIAVALADAFGNRRALRRALAAHPGEAPERVMIGRRLGRPSLFRGENPQPISVTLTRQHHRTIRKAMNRLGLSRADVIALLIEVHGEELRMTKQNDEPARLIASYCAKMGITREQYDSEGMLEQAQVDALWVLAQAGEENPIVPEGLPGAGWPLLDLPDALREQLIALQQEFDEILPGTFFTNVEVEGEDDEILGDVPNGLNGPRRRGWKV